jgi:hypothetical protein
MENQPQEMDVRRYLQIIRAKRYLFVLATAGIISLITAASYFVPRSYEASATVSIEKNYLNVLMQDIAVAPSNPRHRLGGHGRSPARHSGPAYAGTGVFMSADAGRTWRHMGLVDTHHIAKVVIDAKNPSIVYVAAMGHAWTPNAERGVFKTTDGGATWQKVLYKGDGVGAIDLAAFEEFLVQQIGPEPYYSSPEVLSALLDTYMKESLLEGEAQSVSP